MRNYKKRIERKLLRVLKKLYTGKGLYVEVVNLSLDFCENVLIKTFTVEYGRSGQDKLDFCSEVDLEIYKGLEKYLPGMFFAEITR